MRCTSGWAGLLGSLFLTNFVAACSASSNSSTPPPSPVHPAGTSGTSSAGASSVFGTGTSGRGASGAIATSGAGIAAPAGSGGARATAGATTAGTAAPATAGQGGSSTPATAGSGAPIAPGTWPAADPSKRGPYMTTMEQNTGPDGMFTMYRPMDLTDQPHPVVTWGNGTGTTPPVYGFLLDQLASHGFIVIASNSMNVAMGTPPPMIQGVDWVIQENDDAMSPLYHHVDTAHIGATGHSQGAFAATTAGSDMRITAIAPIEGTLPAQLHGPALLLCGGMDTTVGCMGAMQAFTSDTVPCMYASLLAATHTNWIMGSFGFGNQPLHPFVIAVTAWFRVHLMGDTSVRPMFYGADCTMCKDSAWTVMQKNLN